MKTKQFAVSVLLIQDQGAWVAQCLEYDIAAQGATIAEAQKAFQQVFIGQMRVNEHHGKDALDGIPPAPAWFYEKFEEAVRTTERTPFHVPGAAPGGPGRSAAVEDLRIYA